MNARVKGAVAAAILVPAAICPVSPLAASDRESALHSVQIALMLLDDARTALIEGQQGRLRSPPSRAAGCLRDAGRVLENKIPPGSMRSSYGALKREVEQLSAAVSGLPERDEEMHQLARRLYERQAEPAFVRASTAARVAVARGLAEGGALGEDERVRLITAVVVWVGERVAGVRQQTWEQLLSDCPEVTYVRETGELDGPRCRFLAPGARFDSERCARTATPTDSPLAQAASDILTMLRGAGSTPTIRH